MEPVQLLDEKMQEVSRLCEQFGVVELRLFGSALTSQWDPTQSDLDFLVEYGPKYRELDPLDALVGLKGALEELFCRKVDVVNMARVRNSRFRENAFKSSKVVYVA